MAVEGYKSDRPRNLQYLQPVLERDVDEYISREQGEFQFFAAVFPSSYRPVQRQEAGDVAELDLLRHTLFVARAGIEGVPVSLRA